MGCASIVASRGLCPMCNPPTHVAIEAVLIVHLPHSLALNAVLAFCALIRMDAFLPEKVIDSWPIFQVVL